LQKLLAKKMDARVISAFTRVFDALLPAHDGLALDSRLRRKERSFMLKCVSRKSKGHTP
jgi:hypothetical protein